MKAPSRLRAVGSTKPSIGQEMSNQDVESTASRYHGDWSSDLSALRTINVLPLGPVRKPTAILR